MSKNQPEQGNSYSKIFPRLTQSHSSTTTDSRRTKKASSWINKVTEKQNFNTLKTSSLMHTTFETGMANRWLSGAKSITKSNLSPLSTLPRYTTTVDPQFETKSLGTGIKMRDKNQEERLKRFGSRLGNTLPESMQTDNEIVYLGDGMSVELVGKNKISQMLSNLEETSILLQSQKHPKPIAQPGTDDYIEPGIDRYGHEGPWYKRTPRRDKDEHGMQNVLSIGHHPASPKIPEYNGYKKRTRAKTRYKSIVPYDALENPDNNFYYEDKSQQKHNIDIPTPISGIEIYAGGSQVLPNNNMLQVNNRSKTTNNSNHSNQNNMPKKNVAKNGLKETTDVKKMQVFTESQKLNQQSSSSDKDTYFIDTEKEKEHNRLGRILQQHHQKHNPKLSRHLPAKEMYELGDLSRMVKEAHWTKAHKHMLVEHTKCSKKHHSIDEAARQIAELHQMTLEDWNVRRKVWMEGKEQQPRHEPQNSYGRFKNWKSIKIFVSSTFRDMHGERDMINTVVIPQINDILEEYRIQLHAIDLRWGLTAEDTSNSGLGALEHCLREVEQSKPFVISLLGERYGWCPDEYKISNRPEFSWIKNHPPGYSITHLEVLQGLINSWGKPSYGFTYERRPHFIDTIQNDEDRKIFEFDHKSDPTKLKLRNKMRFDLKSHPFSTYHSYNCKYAGRDSQGRAAVGALGGLAEQMITDITSAIIFEYHLIDIKAASLLKFNSKKSEQLRRTSMMRWPGAKHVDKTVLPKNEREALFKELKSKHEGEKKFLLNEARLHDNYMSYFAANFVPRPKIRDAIMKKILECDPQHDSYDQGLEEHAGIKNALRAVAVLGQQGSGKTSLLSEIAICLKSNSYPRARVFSHMCGASPSSGDIKLLLHRLGSDIAQEFKVDKQGVSNLDIFLSLSPNNCRIWFEEILHAAAKNATAASKYIVIIIDGTDQMDEKDDALSLRWLPAWTPSGCRIIISASVYRSDDTSSSRETMHDEGILDVNYDKKNEKVETKVKIEQKKEHEQKEQQKHQKQEEQQDQQEQQWTIEAALINRDPPLPVIPVEHLINDQPLRVVKSLLKQHSKRLTEDQLRLLLKKKDHNRALYLWATLEELRLGGDFGLNGQKINQMIAHFPETLEPLFEQVLKRIEVEVGNFCGEHHDYSLKTRIISGENRYSKNNYPYEISGHHVVQLVLSLLACSRNGLYEEDLLKLACPKDWPYGNSLPPIIWSRIYHAVEPYCRKRTDLDHGIVSFSQRSFARAVHRRYMRKGEMDSTMRSVYKKLADFMIEYSGAKDYQHWSPIFEEKDTFARRHHVTSFVDSTYYQIKALDIAGMKSMTLGNLKYIEMASRISNNGENGNLLANLIHDYRVALNVIKTSKPSVLKYYLKSASTTKREVLWWLKGMHDFVTQQQHNLIRSPLLTLQLALQELKDSAAYLWAKKIILSERLNYYDTNSNENFFYSRWINKPCLKLLRASLGPFAAGGVCCADLGNGLEVLGLENGDVIVMRRMSEEIIAAVRSSSFGNSSYGHCAGVCSLSTCSGYFISTSMDCQVIVWDAKKYAPLAHGGKCKTFTEFEDNILSDINKTNNNSKHIPLRKIFSADSIDGHTNIVTCSIMLTMKTSQVCIELDYCAGTRTNFYFVTGSLDQTSRLWFYERDIPNVTEDTPTTAKTTTETTSPTSPNTRNNVDQTVHGKLISTCTVRMISGIVCAAKSDDLSVIAMGTECGHVQLIDCTKVETNNEIKPRKSWKAHRTSVSSLAYCNIDDHGKYLLATGSLDSSVKIWSYDECSLPKKKLKSPRKKSNPLPLRVLHSSIGGISTVKWAPMMNDRSVRYLVAGTLKEEIIGWSIDRATLKAIRINSFEGHAGVVNDIHFTTEVKELEANRETKCANGEFSMVSLSSDRRLHVWDLFNMNEKASAGSGGDLKELEPQNDKTIQSKTGSGQIHEEAITSCAMSASGVVAVTGDQSGKVVVWNAQTGVPISELPRDFDGQNRGKIKSKQHSEITCISTDNNGDTIVAGTRSGRIFLWQRQAAATVMSLRKSDEGKISKLERQDTKHRIVNTVATRTYSLKISQADVHQMSIQCVLVISPSDGVVDIVTLVTGDLSGELKVWSVNTGLITTTSEQKIADNTLLLKHSHQHATGVQDITYRQAKVPFFSSPSQNPTSYDFMSLLAVTTTDHSVILWDTSSWTLIKKKELSSELKKLSGVTTFSLDTCELSFFDREETKTENGIEDHHFDDETFSPHASSTHTILRNSIKHSRLARVASIRRNLSKNGKLPPQLRAWPIMKAGELGEDQLQIEEKDNVEEKDTEIGEAIWSTVVSHRKDRYLGDNMESQAKFACTAGGGRIIFGAFEDSTLRGYDSSLNGQRCCAFVFPDQIACMAASEETGTANLICGDMHGRVFILDFGIDLDVTWNPNRLNNINEENIDINASIESPVSFYRHRRMSTAMSKIRVKRARNHCDFLSKITPSVYYARTSVKIGKAGQAVAAYSANNGDESSCTSLGVLAQLGLFHEHQARSHLSLGSIESTRTKLPYKCGLQIIGTLDSHYIHCHKFALPQIQTAFELGLFPAALEANALVMDFGVTSTLSKIIGKAYMKTKKIVADSIINNDKSTCHLVGVGPLVSTSITKEQIESVKPGEALEWSNTLERGHENFVLLESTCERGEDTDFCLNVQYEWNEKNISSAIVLVRGGDEEKEMLFHLARLGVPIIVLEGTGGFADEIATLRFSIKERQKTTYWSMVRSKVRKETQINMSQVENLVSLLRLKDEVTKFICTYPKLHVVNMSEGNEKLKPLILRLLKQR
jgi:hypothetical protein